MGQTLFEFVAGALEAATDLGKLEARGTLRIALKQAGLDARTVEPTQMRAVLERALPAQLASRAVASADAVCRALVSRLEGFSPDSEARGDSPEDVFRRLGGGTTPR